MNKNVGIVLVSIIFLSSCVAKKRLTEAENAISSLQEQRTELRRNNQSLKERLHLMEEANDYAENQIKKKEALMLEQENLLLEQQGQLKTHAQTLEEKQAQLLQLQDLIEKQKKQTEELRLKMSEALGGFTSDQLSVFSKNGKVYVSLSEKLLFPSGSAVINKDGKEAIAQLAKALKENPNINLNIEGHTDSIPIKLRFEDNWALGAARSLAIVRLLINENRIEPERITSSNRSQYEPIAENSTPEGRAKNRRTEIILAPKLDELMQLLD